MAITTSATIEKIVNISENIKEFTIKPEKITSYEPGQFLQFSLDNIDASTYWSESRTFSIASYGRDYIKLIIKKVGKYTKRIFEELKEGSKVTIKYAYGDFLLPFDCDDGIVCIAGGTGISPILSFIDKLKEDDELDKIKLFYSARNKEELIDYDNICEILPKDNVYFYVTRQDTKDERIINRRIDVDDIKNNTNIDSYIYICGSNEFINYFKCNLEALGYENIILDEWE